MPGWQSSGNALAPGDAGLSCLRTPGFQRVGPASEPCGQLRKWMRQAIPYQPMLLGFLQDRLVPFLHRPLQQSFVHTCLPLGNAPATGVSMGVHNWERY